MDIQIIPRKLSGSITPPTSKSMAHRLIIAASLGGKISTLQNVTLSDDIEATLNCMKALRAGVEYVNATTLRIHGIGHSIPRADVPLPRFDCGESGSTLRFLIPVALAVSGGGIFVGHGRLMERPQQPYFDLFAEKGIVFEQDGNTLTVQGRLIPGEYRLPGNVSSQFFTGLLFGLSLLDSPSTLISTTALESAGYIRITLEALNLAGIRVNRLDDGLSFTVYPSTYQRLDLSVEADWSQAAFWYAANFLDCGVTIQNLNPNSSQGDMVVADLYWKLARPGHVTIDLADCPDLLPPLAVMAAVRNGTTYFVNGARLRMKESDRLTSVCRMLTALGGQAEEGPACLTVSGLPALQGGIVDGCGDHRIVMAAAIAAAACRTPITIVGADAVSKSYPAFFEDYRSLGGEIHVL